MFASVLIANRGEIACRIIRTARAMGMRTVAVYSRPDRTAPHAGMADEAVALGGARAQESYLRIDAVLRAARDAGVECIHPGYGFLAENSEFAEACAAEGIIYVGPPPAAMRAMGRKDEAKALARGAGAPVLPGYEGDFSDAEALLAAIEGIGYPVMIKAVAGGGGTGMRRVESAAGLPEALEAAKREASSSFGDARLIVEKCLDAPRHIEVQVFADTHGNCIHLFERDCSLQRRRQKIIEEAPTPGMTEGLRRRMCDAAIAAAQAAGYTGAGTVEFLVEDKALSDDSRFYFLEMNTRLQVEHPVTEAITGLDLVEWQFRVAAGEPLGFTQDDIAMTGHAMEARVYCEDADRGFLPSSGKLHLVRWPEGEAIRVDAGVRTGDIVSPYYDPMLAKIIAHAGSRDEAIAGLRDALADTAIAGPHTNLRFLHELLGDQAVLAGNVDTGLVESRSGGGSVRAPDPALVREGIAALMRARRETIAERRGRFSDEAHSPWSVSDGFSLGTARPAPLIFTANGEAARADVTVGSGGIAVSLPELPDTGGDAGAFEIIADGDRVFVLAGLDQVEVSVPVVETGIHQDAAGDGAIRAPMHGRIVALKAVGDRVDEGAQIATLEAMKMEHRLTAPRAGRIAELVAAEGQQVSAGDVIALIEAEEGS